MSNPISDWLRDKGKTIPDLAGEIGITRSGMWKIVKGKTRPSIPMMHRLSAATGIPKEQLRPDLYEAQHDA